MKNYLLYLNRLLLVLAAGAAFAMLGVTDVRAKDTDIYLKAPAIERDDSPNVLIIFDNSISMDTDVTSRPAYVSTIDYCSGDLDTLTGISGANAGKPSGCSSIANRVYWSFGSSPPSMTSSRWAAASKNRCSSSATPFTDAGSYSGTKIVGYRPSGSNKGWRSLNNRVNSELDYIDCQADNGATDTYGYVKDNSKSPPAAYTTVASEEFVWANYTTDTSPKLYPSNYMNYWFNSTLTTTRTRLQIAKGAINGIIDSNPSVRFGLMVFNRNSDGAPADTGNHGGRVVMKIDAMDATRRTDMKAFVNSLTASTSTPLSETLWEARRYFGALGVDYGDNDPTATPARDTAAESGGNYVSPFMYGCQKAFIIYMTDGDPTRDVDADSKIKGLSGLSGSSCQGISGLSGDATLSCLKDLAGWIHNNDVYAGLAQNQTVSTYTIGFGSGISADGKTLLQNTATNGGGKYYAADDADQLTSAFQGALTEILQDTTSLTAPSLSVNAFNRLFNRDEIYFALFKPSASVNWDGNIKKFRLCNSDDVTNHGCEFGQVIDANNVAVIDINSKIKDTAVSFWGAAADGSEVTAGGAGAHITVPRTLYTYRSSYTGLPASPTTVEATAGNALYDAAVLDPTILGLPSSATGTEVASLTNWMRGRDSYDKDNDSDTTEARAWNFADPLHSRPVAVTYGAETTFGQPDPDKPIIKLFVGTNDGIIRIINNDTGNEEWAFLPKELLSNQYSLSQDADGEHIVGADDTPTFWTKDLNNDGVIDPAAGDKVYMYIGMRRGGRNIYAFDVTPTAKMTSQSDTVTPKLMWVIEGGAGDFAKLGQTWSKPKVARIRFKCTSTECDDGDPATDDSASRMVLVFAGGYDADKDNSVASTGDDIGYAIYIVDPLTGERLWWASSDASATLVLSNMKYSIPSEVTLTDTNADKSVDRLYVGDTAGQVWRIDLGDQLDTNQNGGTAGYVFADVGCSGGLRADDCSATSKQARRRFFYPPDVAQVSDSNFSTNPTYDLVTIASGNREDPLDLLTSNLSPVEEAVHNRIYAFRDYKYKYGPPTPTPSALTEGDLYDTTANKLGTLTGAALATEIAAFKDKKGFYIDLVESSAIALPNGLTTTWVGEKALAKTLIFGGILYVTTFTPANGASALQTCSASEGTGKVYALNYLSGVPAFDFDNDGTNDRFVEVGGGIPSEPIIVIREGGVTGLVGTSGGSEVIEVGPGAGDAYKTYWRDE